MHDAPIILFVVNNPAFFVSHRLPIAQAAIKAGYQVHIACPDGAANDVLRNAGLVLHEWTLSRKGLHPLQELKSIASLFRLYKHLQPDIVHHITPKPNIYGGLAARMADVPSVVFAIAGMGYMFSSEAWAQRLLFRPIVQWMYRLAFSGPNVKVIVQNEDDLQLINKIARVEKSDCVLIPGSGVDLRIFSATAEPKGVCTVVLASRLLRDKGVSEFVDAARLLNESGINARFVVAGTPDPGNPASITETQISFWEKEGIVEFPGYVENVAELYTRSHIAVLPSYYREGLPKSLIEAAACGRPIITTDMPGCRDALIPGVSGLLVPSRNTDALAKAIVSLINNPDLRINMGKAGRKLAEEKFSIQQVVKEHLDIYTEFLRDAA